MLKLKLLKEQKEAQAQKAAAPDEHKKEGTTTAETFVLTKQNSKDLVEMRKQKSKENVLSLKKQGGTQNKKGKTPPAQLRAMKDVAEFTSTPGITVNFPDPTNIMMFFVLIKPNDGLYKFAEFKFSVNILSSYPYDPPKVHCETPIYHPNIDTEGHVCLNILREDWTPVLNLGSVLFGLMTLFVEPNPGDPLNKEAAKLMIEKPGEFEKNVRQTLKGGWVLGRQYPELLK